MNKKAGTCPVERGTPSSSRVRENLYDAPDDRPLRIGVRCPSYYRDSLSSKRDPAGERASWDHSGAT
jgi:hypothetical protein